MKLYFFIFLLALTACSTPVVSEPVVSDDGALYLGAATHAARTAVSERKTAVSAASTAERQRFYDDQTATPLAATAEAYTADQTATADLRTSVFVHDQQTDVAHARETETRILGDVATAQASAIAATNGTATAEAQASATALAYQTDAPLTALAKDYAAQQMQHQIAQAEADAIRARAWGDFFDGLMKFIVACGSVALLVVLLFALSKYLDSLAMARRVVETREGAVLLTIVEGRPAAQLIRSVPNLLDEPRATDYFDLPSEAATAREIPVRTISGRTFTVSDAPASDESEERRALALWLLRESKRYFEKRGFDARKITRLASWRELECSADTWSRALDVLRPHVRVQKGRGGGVFCEDEYPNLMALYVAVGERRAALSKTASSLAS